MDIIIVNQKVIALENGKPVGKMTFKHQMNYLVIDDTSISEELGETGLEEKLVAALVEYARDQEVKILPKCNIAKRILEKNTQYQDILFN